MRDSFIVYNSFLSAIRAIKKRDIQGELALAIIEYGITGEISECGDMVAVVMELIKPQIDINHKKYLNGCKGAEYGKLGGRPKTPKKPQENPTQTPMGFLEKREKEKKKVDKEKIQKEKKEILNPYNPLFENSHENKELSTVSGKLSEHEAIFDIFIKRFGGTKRGLNTEFENFKKKHKDWKDVLPLLLPALEKQIEWRAKAKAANSFVPEWKHLKTWINQRCWEEELNFETDTRNEQKTDYTSDLYNFE
ncbi:MAG: DUF6291 domain-containing protein [Prevotellaceae bacterium]|jgi:hypothetical protein|nr:DUF6291 domain-containing protein [Prevotellaceae bacterium]